MAKELDITDLSSSQISDCLATVGPNTFFMLVGDALASSKPLSVVRMGDGEKQLYNHCKSHTGAVRSPNSPFGDDWLRDFGCLDIPCEELKRRLEIAANTCTFFSPQIMGITRDQWAIHDLFHRRGIYVDNWFVREWSRKLQDQLLVYAKHVLFLHGSDSVRLTFASRASSLGVQADCLTMGDWRDGDSIITLANEHPAQLVLFSGGPSNKYIAPAIATQGRMPKVVLDLGQAAAKEWL